MGSFLTSYVGDEKYELAYKLLSENFKNNYFKTYEEFKDYAQKKYPTMVEVSYGDLQRQGDIYIIDATVKDLLKKKETFTQTFVIKENSFNNYEIAFSV